MKVLPTLQIRQGRSISYFNGGSETDPFEHLSELLDLGCQRVAFVDVDAAQGTGNNRELLGQLMRRCRSGANRVCIQVGGGIRGSDQAQFFVDQGATWLLVGTLVYKSAMAVDQLLARFHEHLTAAIDARDGMVKSSGWVVQSALSAADAARHVRELGFKRLLFVDIPGDSEAHPDVATARIIAEQARLPLFMWSRFATLDQVADVTSIPGVQGVQLDVDFVRTHAEALRTASVGCQ